MRQHCPAGVTSAAYQPWAWSCTRYAGSAAHTAACSCARQHNNVYLHPLPAISYYRHFPKAWPAFGVNLCLHACCLHAAMHQLPHWNIQSVSHAQQSGLMQHVLAATKPAMPLPEASWASPHRRAATARDQHAGDPNQAPHEPQTAASLADFQAWSALGDQNGFPAALPCVHWRSPSKRIAAAQQARQAQQQHLTAPEQALQAHQLSLTAPEQAQHVHAAGDSACPRHGSMQVDSAGAAAVQLPAAAQPPQGSVQQDQRLDPEKAGQRSSITVQQDQRPEAERAVQAAASVAPQPQQQQQQQVAICAPPSAQALLLQPPPQQSQQQRPQVVSCAPASVQAVMLDTRLLQSVPAQAPPLSQRPQSPAGRLHIAAARLAAPRSPQEALLSSQHAQRGQRAPAVQLTGPARANGNTVSPPVQVGPRWSSKVLAVICLARDSRTDPRACCTCVLCQHSANLGIDSSGAV